MKVQEQSATYLAQKISGGWCEKPLRDLLTKLVDGSHNPPPKQDSGLPMLSARNIENNNIVFDEYRLISEGAFKTEYARTRITAGDVLLTIVGTIGRAAVVPEAARTFSLQRSVAVLTPGPELLPKFLVYQLQSPVIQRYFEAKARGTAQKGVYLKTLGQTPIQVAPLDQQKRIVAEIEKQFSRLDEAVANLKRVKANLKRYKAAVLKAAVEGRLVETEAERARRYETGAQLLQRILETRRRQWQGKGKYKEPAAPDATDLPELPEGWVWATVEQLNPVNRPCAYGVLQPGDDLSEGVLFVRVGDINDGRVDSTGLKVIAPAIAGAYPRTKLAGGEVLITLVGAIGRTAVVPASLAGANVARAVGVLPLADPIDPHWVEIWFRNPRKIVEMTAKSHEVARKTLNLEDVRYATVAIPPLVEQNQIVGEVESRFSITDETEAQINANLQRAECLRQSVLASAFSPLPSRSAMEFQV